MPYFDLFLLKKTALMENRVFVERYIMAFTTNCGQTFLLCHTGEIFLMFE